MGRWIDLVLNVLLGLLVASSVALSSLVWFPSEHAPFPATTEPLVQAAPPDVRRRVPDVGRPERIEMRRKDGHVAVLTGGALLFAQSWNNARSALRGLQPQRALPPGEEPAADGTVTERVTLVLPAALRLGDWADQWSWSTGPLPDLTILVDRITFHLGRSPSVTFSGPDTATLVLGPLSEADTGRLQELVHNVEPSRYAKPRTLDSKPLFAQIMPGVHVPEIPAVPVVSVRAQKPLDTAEAARFFPDLSVVRQIDEKDASSLTDGQRLLRMAANGVLEFRTAGAPAPAMDFRRTLVAAKEWVETHSGWPQDVLLSSVSDWAVQEQAAEVRLSFDYRMAGPYPLETAEGAVLVQFAGSRAIYLKRLPDFGDLTVSSFTVPVITPEEALRFAAERAPGSLLRPVRDVHMAYLIQPGQNTSQPEWRVQPAWVFVAGDARIYVPAVRVLEERPVTVFR